MLQDKQISLDANQIYLIDSIPNQNNSYKLAINLDTHSTGLDHHSISKEHPSNNLTTSPKKELYLLIYNYFPRQLQSLKDINGSLLIVDGP